VPLISDGLLGAFAKAPVARLRRWAGRRAARRALHAVALEAAPDDAATLALLGLYNRALMVDPHDADDQSGQLVARAALGELPSIGVARALDSIWRRRLASVAAPRDPAFAAALLPDGMDQAACAYALHPLTAALLLTDAKGRDAAVMRAGVAFANGDHSAGRIALNAAFALDGLAPPLEIVDRPATIDAFAGDPAPVGDGPLVSIVMPLHQGAETVAMALASLQRQSHRDLQIIVVDDRSHDLGPALVAQIAAADRRVRLLANDREPGVAGARNTGIAAAAGAFIGFLDADDWAHPDRIARQLASSGTAGAVGAHFRIDPAGMPVAPRVWPMVRLCPISMLVRRAALLAAGPFEIAPTGSDAEMLARLDLLYGRGAIRRDPAILTVQLWRARSLSNDGGDGLISADRYDYRAQWMARHHMLWRGGGLPRPVPAS
jgi:hypothetical protein